MPPLITISAKAVILREGQLLVATMRWPDGISHILPGGTQEHGESLDACLRRECLEEIGTEVEVGQVLFVREYIGKNHQFAEQDGDAHNVSVMFACEVPDDYIPRLGSAPDTHQVAVRWLAVDELEEKRLLPTPLGRILMAGAQTPVYLGDVF